GAQRPDAIINPFATLTVLAPFPRRLHRLAGTGLEQFDLLAGIPLLAVIAYKARLVVEGVALAGGTGHEQLNDTLRLGSEVRPAERSGEQSLLNQQARQGDAAKSAAELPEELPAISVANAAVHVRIARHQAVSVNHRGFCPRGHRFPFPDRSNPRAI